MRSSEIPSDRLIVKHIERKWNADGGQGDDAEVDEFHRQLYLTTGFNRECDLGTDFMKDV